MTVDSSKLSKTYEMLVGLEVIDDALYADYRRAMMPILETYSGGFRYDFRILEVLKSEAGNSINRVFTIYFKDKESKESFFSDPNYLKVKAEFFLKSVKVMTIISEYERG